MPTSSDQMGEILEAELSGITDSALRARSTAMLVTPFEKTLRWEYGEDEAFTAWVVVDMKERDVWVAYCEGGHGALGFPWGLVFGHSDGFGQDNAWYRSLRDLFEEWFVGVDRR